MEPQTQLLRQYPGLFAASEILAGSFHEAIRTMLARPEGELEVEASFGEFSGKGTSFEPVVPPEQLRKMAVVLDKCAEWTKVSDWYLVYDYRVIGAQAQEGERVRESYEDGNRTITRIRKIPLNRTDLEYRPNGRYVRINMKAEQPVATDENDCLHFSEVRISCRKCYVLESRSLPGIGFRYELIHSWSGATEAEAEANFHALDARCSLECEILKLPRGQTMSRVELIVLFLSLLLKMQDLLDIPENSTTAGYFALFSPHARS